MKDLNEENSIYEPDVRCKAMIFLYSRVQVELILKVSAHHHRNLLLLCSMFIGFVNMHRYFSKPKITNLNLDCYETEAGFLTMTL